jgi:very-short-patch-repair endonuclease
MKNLNNNHYNKTLKTFARSNRKKQTYGELLLWSKLRNKQMCGLKFLRQRAIYKYIVDFFQPENRLIIEIDGSSHDENKFNYDARRQIELENLGYSFLRFTDYEVRRNLNSVLETIYLRVNEILAASPTLPSLEEGV